MKKKGRAVGRPVRRPARKTKAGRIRKAVRRPVPRPKGPPQCGIVLNARQGTFTLASPAGVPLLEKAWAEVELADGDVLTTLQGGLAAQEGCWSSELANGRIALELVFERVAEPPAVVVTARVRNRGAEPLAVREIRIGRAVMGPPPPAWGAIEGWRLLKLGYTFGAAHREDADGRNSGLVAFDRPSASARSFGVTALRLGPRGPALVLGFLTAERQVAWIDVRKEGREIELAPACETEGRVVAPGTALAAERLYVGLHADPFAGLAAYGALCARAAKVELKPVPRGWCSWYAYFASATAGDIARNAQACAGLRAELPLPVVQIDAGHARAMGDWLEAGPRFPEGLAPVAARIRELGLVPGVWVAPFAVEPASRLAAEHPDWLVQDEGGKPLAWDVEWAEPKVPWHGLDGSHPEARAWLTRTFAALREMGFAYFKLDFLFMGCLRGVRAAPVTRAEAYRAGMLAVRAGAGPDAYLLACTAPYPQTAGLADGMRTSHDVYPGGESIRNFGAVSAETHHRWWAHRALWNADPDVLVVRDLPGATPGTPRAVCLSAALSGGALFAGDPLEGLTEDRLALLKEALALSRTAAAVPLDLFEREQPRLLAQALGRGRFRVGVFNHEPVARVVPLELERLGLARARVTVLDGAKAFRPVLAGRRYLPPAVPARGALLLLVERA